MKPFEINKPITHTYVMKKSSFVVIFVLLQMLFAQNASALFGSECKQPKKSLSSLDNEIKSLKVANQVENSNWLKKTNAVKAQWANVDCNSKAQLAAANKKFGTNTSSLGCLFNKHPLLVPPSFSHQNELDQAIATRNQLLATYPKCFDPTEVAKAKVALNN